MHYCASHTLQSTLESGQDARIVQIDFGAAFVLVNHQGILYKLCCVGALRYLYFHSFYQTDHNTLWSEMGITVILSM